MNELQVVGFAQRMSSREIAELTEKRHDNVLRDIKTLIDQGAISALNFEEAEYMDAQGKPRPEYLLDFDATMTLVTGYNAVLRAKVIRRWRELEEGGVKPVVFPPSTQKELEARDLKAKMEIFKVLYEAAEFFGLKGNQALLCADKSFKRDYGDSFTARLQIELKSPDNEKYLIATEVGRLFQPEMSPVRVNALLRELGFMERRERVEGKWENYLTDKGKEYGIYLDTGKKHSDGTPIQQIKWKESVVPFLRSYLDE